MSEEEEDKKPAWEYKEEFGIVTKMREIILASVGATEKELELLRKKLERLTYGG